MKFNLKLFVLVGVLAGFRDVCGMEEDGDDFYVNKAVKNNQDLIEAVNGRRVIKAVYKKEEGGPVDIIYGDFKDNLFRILVCAGDEENGVYVHDSLNVSESGKIYRYMQENVKYTAYFVFNNELLNSTASMFYTCENLIHADFTYFNTTNVTTMSSMFEGCSSLTKLDLSNFNTQSVTNMSSMFQGCFSLNKLDLSKFDTTSVKDMSWMFAGCTALKDLDLSSFNTQSVTNMFYMFQGCISLNKLNLSNFDTQNVTDMSSIFEGCTDLKNLNLGNFVFPNGCKMENIFLLCKFDNLCIPNTRKICWCCCGRYVYLKGKVVVKLNQNNVEFEGE